MKGSLGLLVLLFLARANASVPDAETFMRQMMENMQTYFNIQQPHSTRRALQDEDPSDAKSQCLTSQVVSMSDQMEEFTERLSQLEANRLPSDLETRVAELEAKLNLYRKHCKITNPSSGNCETWDWGECVHGLWLGPGTREYEIHAGSARSVANAGVGAWTLSAYIYVHEDYNGRLLDGRESVLHHRFWDAEGTILSEGDTGYFTERGKWIHVSGQVQNAGAVDKFSLYLGYPGQATAGYILLAEPKVLGPDGRNYVGNGCFADGTDVENMEGSHGDYKVVNLVEFDYPVWDWGVCNYALWLGVGAREYEVHAGPDLDTSTAGTGEWTMSAMIYASSTYDGAERVFHSRFFGADGVEAIILGRAGHLGEFSAERDTWTRVSHKLEIDVAVSMFKFHIGYPGQGNAGYLLVTDVSVMGPDGVEYIVNGCFAEGQDIANQSDSHGNYEIVRLSEWNF